MHDDCIRITKCTRRDIYPAWLIHTSVKLGTERTPNVIKWKNYSRQLSKISYQAHTLHFFLPCVPLYTIHKRTVVRGRKNLSRYISSDLKCRAENNDSVVTSCTLCRFNTIDKNMYASLYTRVKTTRPTISYAITYSYCKKNWRRVTLANPFHFDIHNNHKCRTEVIIWNIRVGTIL